MADAPQFKFDESAFKDKLVRLTQLKADESGKPNKNPYLWFGKTVQPLIDRYQIKGERSKELYDALMAVKEVVPLINPNVPEAKK